MTNDNDFNVIVSDEPVRISETEYEKTVESIAEKCLYQFHTDEYDSIIEAVEDTLENHLYVIDISRAIQCIRLADNSPESFQYGEDKARDISRMAKTAMMKDIMDRAKEIEGERGLLFKDD